MVAKKLETKIRDAILTATRGPPSSSVSLFSQDATGLLNLQRPRAHGAFLTNKLD
jgi:sec1 family domain-containing protein 1